MAKWLVAVGALAALVGALLWKLSAPPDAPRPITAPGTDAGAAAVPIARARADARVSAPEPAPPDATPGNPDPARLDPGSDAFQHRVDTVIPMKFRAAAARCYDGGLDDRTLKVHYQLRIIRGEVFATNVYAAKSELDDKELERCMVNAVEQARWRADDLPDLDEEQELFIRLRTLKKYNRQADEPGD